MRDPHLSMVRRAHALQTRMGRKLAAKSMGVKAAEFDALMAEYWERRKARTLYVDIENTTEADMYNHASIMTAEARRNAAREDAET